MGIHYPLVEVEVRPPATPPNGEPSPDNVQRILVDGQQWPVTEIKWELTGGQRHPLLTIKIRGRLRIIETVE